MNIAKAIGSLNEALNEYGAEPEGDGSCASEELAALLAMDSVLGVMNRNDAVGGGGEGDAEIDKAVAARSEAKAKKDWAEADRLREELLAHGIALHDSPEGTTWTRVIE